MDEDAIYPHIQYLSGISFTVDSTWEETCYMQWTGNKSLAGKYKNSET